MSIEFILLVISSLLATSVGYYSQRVGLCMVRGVTLARNKKPSFLLAILCSGSFSWVAIILAYQLHHLEHFTAYQLTLLPFIGGILFGLGAAFNHGCGVSTLTRLVRGEVKMSSTIIGWLVGWILLTPYMDTIEQQKVIYDIRYQGWFLFIFSFIILVLITRLNSASKIVWKEMLLIGFMASLVFVYEPHWTPSGLLQKISLSVWDSDDSQWPSLPHFILVFSLLAGMLLAAFQSQLFKFEPVRLTIYLKHLSAGIMMGIGAVIAGGGNDSQLLIGIPSLSPASFASIFSMIAGIYLGIKWQDILKIRRTYLG